MADADWLKIAAQSGISLLTGLGGLFLGVWQAGRKRGREDAAIEERLRAEVSDEIKKLREEMMKAIAAAADNRELLVGQFHESFNGIRRQIDENKLQTEQQFVRKDAFKEFREENSEKLQRMEDKIDRLLGLNGARKS